MLIQLWPCVDPSCQRLSRTCDLSAEGYCRQCAAKCAMAQIAAGEVQAMAGAEGPEAALSHRIRPACGVPRIPNPYGMRRVQRRKPQWAIYLTAIVAFALGAAAFAALVIWSFDR